MSTEHALTTDLPQIEVVLSTFDAAWPDLRRAAIYLDERGIGGLWIMDHFSGTVHDRGHVLECWTTLGALAEATTRCRLGTLVANMSVRQPVVLAQAAATLQAQSGGRLVLGLGAGGGDPGSAYAAEVEWIGEANGSATERRDRLVRSLDTIRSTWSGSLHADATGFLLPDPTPPVVIGGYGPKVATVAGAHADGFNTSAANPRLSDVVCIARDAHADRVRNAGHDGEFTVSAFVPADQNWLDPGGSPLQEIRAAGVDTVQFIVSPPFDAEVLERVTTFAKLG
ncbi:MAG: LLM class flavin-dependent oxidoreductase [Acidimicrobiales bacterium]